MSLHQSYHSIWISCTNHSVWELFSCKWCHGIRRLCTKSDINHKLGSFDECNSLLPSRSLFDWGRDLSGYEKFAFNLFVHFKFKCIFPLIYSKLTRQTTYILPRTMKTTSKVQLEHTQSLHYMNIRQFPCAWVVFHRSWIPFSLRRLCSTTCHFLVNNLHLITNSNRIAQPHWKNSHGMRCYWYLIIHAILQRFDFFCE